MRSIRTRILLPIIILIIAATSVILGTTYLTSPPQTQVNETVKGEVALPKPITAGTVSVEEALERRASIRNYTDQPITMQQVSQLLWAAQGITRPSWGGRTAPSAGGTYPLEVYLVVAKNGVEGLTAGVYQYIPQRHEITLTVLGDRVSNLSAAALNQSWVADARINIVIAAVYERTTDRYGERGVQYVHMEAGHAAQNLYLEATALNLGMVSIGAFNDEQVQKVCELPKEQKPLYVIPIGHPRS